MKALLMLVGIFLTSIASAQNMGLALEGDDWYGVREYPVKGRAVHVKQKISFGHFKTIEVDRSWTRGSTVTTGLTQGIPTDEFYNKLITTDYINKKQTLYFALEDTAGNRASAYCVSQFNARDFNLGNNSSGPVNIILDLMGKGGESSSAFLVLLYDEPGQTPWKLVLDNQAAVAHPKHYVGYLAKSKDDFYKIIPVSRIKTKKGKVGEMPFGSAGFEIRNKEGEALAAVSLMDRGVVYLRDLDAKERILLATACTSLLLQEEIE